MKTKGTGHGENRSQPECIRPLPDAPAAWQGAQEVNAQTGPNKGLRDIDHGLYMNIMPGSSQALHIDWMNLKINLAWAYDGAVPKSGRNRTGSPGNLSAWLIRKGSLLLEAEGSHIKAQAGDWVFPWPGYRKQTFSPDAQIMSVSFHAQWPDGRPFFDHGLSLVFPRESCPDLEAKARNIIELVRPYQPEDFVSFYTANISFEVFLKIKMSLLDWLCDYYMVLSRLGVRPTRIEIKDERVVQALHILDNLPLDERITITTIASNCGLSSSQFVRVFRNHARQTPKQYHEQRRRDFARRMLSGSKVPIKEIALQLGFINLQDFSNWFKSISGFSPRHFRYAVIKSKVFE